MKQKVLLLGVGVILLAGGVWYVTSYRKGFMATKTKEEIMAQAKIGDTVKINYTGRLDDGSVFDSSVNREPLQFTLGSKQVIPGFEEGVLGMNVGEKKTIHIPAEKAYGKYREELVQVITRQQLPPTLNPQEGQQLQATQPNGQAIVFMVKKVENDQITLDANFPLAGQDLTFDLELVEIV